MKGCLGGCLNTVSYVTAAFIGLLILIAVMSSISDNSVKEKKVKRRSTQSKEISAEQKQQQIKDAKGRQRYKEMMESQIPKYEVVATNSNGHTIFIVSQATKKSDLKTIVEDYKNKNDTPSHTWMIQFFSDKQKALRVKNEWSTPLEDDPNFEQWVYKENVDHSGIAQWTSWDGLALDKW